MSHFPAGTLQNRRKLVWKRLKPHRFGPLRNLWYGSGCTCGTDRAAPSVKMTDVRFVVERSAGTERLPQSTALPRFPDGCSLREPSEQARWAAQEACRSPRRGTVWSNLLSKRRCVSLPGSGGPWQASRTRPPDGGEDLRAEETWCA